MTAVLEFSLPNFSEIKLIFPLLKLLAKFIPDKTGLERSEITLVTKLFFWFLAISIDAVSVSENDPNIFKDSYSPFLILPAETTLLIISSPTYTTLILDSIFALRFFEIDFFLSFLLVRSLTNSLKSKESPITVTFFLFLLRTIEFFSVWILIDLKFSIL